MQKDAGPPGNDPRPTRGKRAIVTTTATAWGLHDLESTLSGLSAMKHLQWPWRWQYISVGAGDARTWLITLRRVMANNAVP